MAKEEWMRESDVKRVNLSRQLGIPIEKKIPDELLDSIIKAKPGDIIKNPASYGRREIKVTKVLERRAILARNLRNLPRRK